MADPTESPAPATSRFAVFIATGCGLGYMPKAPGTWGSIGGIFISLTFANILPLALWERLLPQTAVSWMGTHAGAALLLSRLLPYLLVTAVVSLAGVWASGLAAQYFRQDDPCWVVVDEISGQMISYLPLVPLGPNLGGWKYILLGFILFRVFDIWKPFPARQAEKWPGGWGIMADDWFAALYAALILWAVKSLHWLG